VSQQTDVPRPHPCDVPGAFAGAPLTFAEMAVELHLTKIELPQISYALLLETMVRYEKARGVEQLAMRIGLDREIAKRIVHDANWRTDLLGAAHLTFKALIPHAAELHRLLALDAEWRAKFRSVD
jgi:hypothetical protein